MSIAELAYRSAPRALQHVMTSAQGARLRRLRYTDHTWQTLEFLNASQYWTRSQLEEFQLVRLRRLVRHAMERVPFYRDRYRSLGLGAATLDSLDDIQKLPVISRDEFRRRTAEFVREDVSRDRMWVAHTSGTSGSPLSVWFTHRDMQERIAFMERVYQWYTPGRWRRRASFTGKLIVSPHDLSGVVHRTNLALRQQLYSSHHLRPELLPAYVSALAGFAPSQIDGIASPIFAVADHLVRSGQAGAVRPNVVLPTSETLWPHIRERLERGFDAPVANQYGSQEGAPIAYECPEGGFHLCLESGVFEVLRADGSPCAAGESGRLVVTSFFTEGTPLIRYDIGDVASLRADSCSCGRPSPLFERVEGRRDDMFYTEERGIVTRVDSAFKGLPNSIMAAQVAQVALDRFELRIIPDRTMYEPAHGDVVAGHLHSYIGDRVLVDIRVVDDLPRTRGGKLPAMVNECRDPVVVQALANGWNALNA